MTTLTKKDKEAIGAWRERHFKQLEETLNVAISIRDNDKANAKDRIEAGKLIARMLHALQPEREGTKMGATSTQKPILKPEHQTILDEILSRS